MNTDQAMREGFRELERRGELCECYGAYDNNGVLFPHYCERHRKTSRCRMNTCTGFVVVDKECKNCSILKAAVQP